MCSESRNDVVYAYCHHHWYVGTLMTELSCPKALVTQFSLRYTRLGVHSVYILSDNQHANTIPPTTEPYIE